MDGLGKDSRLMRIQYLSLTVKRARKHEKSMAGDYGPTIEDDLLYAKLREVGRARKRLRGSPTQAARPRASEALEEPVLERVARACQGIIVGGRFRTDKDMPIDALRNH
jgi:hypothetical protein